ncbi:transketolase [Microbacterium sp. AISO3]|jgi:transketolase|uniref:transketolase family protein n=1 Tax=Microbacterium TaxID=33882 RepID=UPI00038F2F8F|nr:MULTISPECIES: transketolase [Microbacterium]APF34977.1 transketolase [Microbacterium paludicola]OWP21272.1 transketolase [Microbacterium sp. AISO3]QCR41471.1 transketolase [Microbacterium sp. SGAir0570]GAD34913.1 putative transketolase, C-terminal subunit [Microbacterium sp. TS-1]
MRARFSTVMSDLLATDDRATLVLADIGPLDLAAGTPAADRVVNVGIREQAMIGVAAGLSLAGLRPFVHTYAPFLVERPFEQIKLDLSHQDLGAVLVSIGASYDAAAEGRTHQCPGDIALLSTLPGWRLHTPGHPDEVETLVRAAASSDDRQYIRLSTQKNLRAFPTDGRVHLVHEGTGTLVLAIGPLLDAALEAAAGEGYAVAYTATPVPLDRGGLRELSAGFDRVVVVEPFLEGTTAATVGAALRGSGVLIEHVGVGVGEQRRYGTPADHARLQGLDAPGIRRRLDRLS